MICSACQTTNEAEAQYCEDCGLELTPPPQASSPTHRAPFEVGRKLVERFEILGYEQSQAFYVYRAKDTLLGLPVRLVEESAPCAAPPLAGDSLQPGGGDSLQPRGGESLLQQGSESLLPHGPDPQDGSLVALLWRALCSPGHSGLWTVKDFLVVEGRGVILGVDLQGSTLAACMQGQGRLEVAEARSLASEVGAALEHLHERGYVHLGLRPEALLRLPDGRWMIDGYDFLEAQGAQARSRKVSPTYSSPEAFGVEVCGPVTASSDQFGLGAVLHYALSGQQAGEHTRERNFSFVDLGRLGLDCPQPLAQAVMCAVSKLPGRRFPTLRDFVEALHVDPPVVPVPATVPEAAPALASTPALADGLHPGQALEAGPILPTSPGLEHLDTTETSAPLLPVGEGASFREGGSAPEANTPSQESSLGREGGTPAQAGQGSEADPVPQPVSHASLGGIRVATVSDVGLVRSVNQDSCLVLGLAAMERSRVRPATLVVVADGMGGEAEGDKASSLAIRAMASYVVQAALPVAVAGETTQLRSADPMTALGELLEESIQCANSTILAYASRDAARRGMGSTLTAMMLLDGEAVFGHAGDTRAYLWRPSHPDEVDPITEDHSVVGKLVRLGQISREEARNSPQRSYLYRALGSAENLEVDLYRRSLQPGDRLLLCSDGVWEYFDDPEVAACMGQAQAPDAVCRELLMRVLARGADDNCTAVVVFVDSVEAVPGLGTGVGSGRPG